jgi:isoleucyl-tRNA synthetase
VIFLATSQWFIRLDGELQPATDRQTLRAGGARRDRPRRAVDPGVGPRPHVQHGREPPGLVHLAPARLGRADPGVDCTKCGEAIITPALVEKRAACSTVRRRSLVRAADRGVRPDGLPCPKCGGTAFEREMNILDVWFDSGSSHEAVLSRRPELTWPADIYLEGSDQHRGWFQSSLLVGLGTRGRPPFSRVVTHGFSIDVDGRRCRSRSATRSSRRTSSGRAAPTSSRCGWR